jgi:hypothetical protein
MKHTVDGHHLQSPPEEHVASRGLERKEPSPSKLLLMSSQDASCILVLPYTALPLHAVPSFWHS